jgi:glucan phosphoethanolaminetransferase (alkaline phosphatase superfamily)
MTPKRNSIIMQNRVFLWLALATGLILLIPLVSMQFTNEVNWTLSDFIIASILLYGTSSLFVCVARIVDKKYRIAIGIIFLVGLIYLWAELAVGIFTTWGS